MTTVDNSVDSVDNTDAPEQDNTGIRIPGAIWPDPAKMSGTLNLDRRDPFAMQDRSLPMRRRVTDIYEDE